ncbi:MAG: asparaginase [Planctomycetes bacterium]|nr:asparaginase [Planctomycetota bacterium]MCB9886070.1 asparaginase [Planctomycetota bacterium]
MTAADPNSSPILAEATRSGRTESWHRGALAVVHDGELLVARGDVGRPIYARSATKPLQALPFLERGLHRQLAMPAAEIAVMCASHVGAPVHLAAVRSFLARAGLDEDRLGCGPHAPFDKASRLALLAAGERPRKVHNNCSGKHTGFLCLAQACGDDLDAYLDPECRAQQEVRAVVAAMAGLPVPPEVGLDGCGAPTFWLPLAALARAFAQLANPAGLPPVRAAACRTVLDAVAEQPVLLQGEGLLCTSLVQQLPGRCFPKNGAEGVFAVALAPDPARRRCPGAVGIAVKIDDGSQRGYEPVVVDTLRWLGAFGGEQVPAALRSFWRVPIENTQRRPVGEVRCTMEWPA